MKIIKGYKSELKLNQAQIQQCVRYCGTARWVYNWGLAKKIMAYQETGKSPSFVDLSREITVLKNTDLPWLNEVSRTIITNALRNLDTAYSNFFRRVKNGAAEVGFPKFKSRVHGLGKFCLHGIIKVYERHIVLPKLGKLRLKRHGYIPMAGVKVLAATISEKAGRWFVSVQIEQEIADPVPNKGEVIGIDMGIKAMATCSNGMAFDNPKPLNEYTERLARWQRRLSRRVKGSQNRKKAQRKVAKLHAKIANIRVDSLHKATAIIIAQKPQAIVMEDLHIGGMVKNHKLARAISDVGMGEFSRQISYKAAWQGIEVIYADKWFPSSKTCSHCGQVKEKLSLSERTYYCDICGFSLDRDLNAAINLKNTVGNTGINACGDGKLHADVWQVPVGEAGKSQRTKL